MTSAHSAPLADPDRRARWMAGAAVVLLWVFFVAVQLAGIDYGHQHPDEQGNLDQAAWSLHQRWPGPAYYFYPYGLFALIQLIALPEIVSRGLDGASSWLVAGEADVLLRARTVLVLLSSVVVPATWSLARRTGAGRLEAIVATVIVATSWQLGFHARFIATDALVTALTTVIAALLVSAYVLRAPRLLYVAAAFIGVGAGLKYYPVVLVLVGAGVCVAFEARHRVVRTLAVSALICSLAFVVTTPGAILEPGLIVRALVLQRQIYGGGWFAYAVDGPAGVIAAISQWFLFVALGKSIPLAIVLALCAVLGLVTFGRAAPTRIVLATSAALVLPFLLQNTFLSRNMLPLIPFLAVGAARGIVLVASRVGAASTAATIVSAVVLLAVSGASGVRAASSIRRSAQDPSAAFKELRAFVDAHRDEVFVGSPQVRAELPGRDHVVGVDDPRIGSSTMLIAQPGELWVEWEWPANDPFLIVRTFGPQEVDLRYTPSWRGRPRVVMLPLDRARQAGAALDFHPLASSSAPVLPFHLLER